MLSNVIIISFLFKVINNYVVFPLNKLVNHSPKDNVTFRYFNEFISPVLYTNISATEESNLKIIAFINCREKGFYLKSDESCHNLAEYDFFLSRTTRSIPKEKFDYKSYSECFFTQETFNLFSDVELKNKIKIMNMTYVFSGGVNELKCANLGLKYKEFYLDKSPAILNELKKNGGVDKYIWTIRYNKEDEGLLIMGAFPHEYDKTFSKDTYTQQAVTQSINNDFWYLTFSDIHVADKEISSGLKAEIYPEFGVIAGTVEYFERVDEMFFNQYFINDTCVKEKIEFYVIYSCDKRYFGESSYKRFPELNFFHLGFRFNFTFKASDLFVEYGNRIYFNIIQNIHYEYEWTLGKTFLQKYQFVFNPDAKVFGFYPTQIYTPGYKNYKVAILVLVIFIFLLILGSLISGYGWSKICFYKRRVLANELEEEYISGYESINEVIENKKKENKLGVRIIN